MININIKPSQFLDNLNYFTRAKIIIGGVEFCTEIPFSAQKATDINVALHELEEIVKNSLTPS